MHSILVLVLISVLQFSISFPAVAGDCYDDPLKNNKSYDNCATCYQTLVNALIDTEDNKYHLGRTFFPDDDVKPVEVAVNYRPTVSDSDDNHDVNCTTNCTTHTFTITRLDTTWYWIIGEFYVYQPLDVFMYRSLFFSPPLWRQQTVDLYLPRQCFKESDNYYKFFKYLTQRLRLYATHQSATAEISDTYVGRAIRASHPQLDDDDVTGDVSSEIVPAVYVVPFIAVFIFVIVSLIALCLFECITEEHNITKCKTTRLSTSILEGKKTLKDFKEKINNDLRVQGNLAAVCFLCCIFTIYAFCLDMKSIAIENSANLPKFFHKKSYGFFVITLLFTSVSLIFDLIGIFGVSVVFLHNAILSCFKSDDSCCKKKWEVYIPILFCIASGLLSLSFHFQNILIAWSTVPFYASRIALFYGIIIFCYFLCVKYAYSLPLKILRRNEKKEKDPQKSHWNTCELITVVISLFLTTSVCTGIILVVATFIIHVPINNSIEHSLTGISSLFNGAVILIGGYIAYTVGIKHFGNPFSFEDALKNAMNEIKTTPFDPDDVLNWRKLSEEKRMTEVMKALIHRETSKGYPYKDPSPQPSNQEHS